MSDSLSLPLEVLASRVRLGRIRAEDLVHEAAAAHEAKGADLNAYVEWGNEQALARAREVDAWVARGRDPGALAGVPVSVKDLYGVEGFRTRAGTSLDLPPPFEGEGFLVRRLKAAGALIVGKTHTVEMAYGGVGINPHRGTPVNPWDAGAHRVPGGSSSGAGVSLWEGSAVVALGSDTGGSIRIPASATGVFGHKTTAGRWPTTGVVPLSRTLDTVGALTRTAADAEFLFSVIDGAPAADRALSQLRIGVPARVRAWTTAQSDIAEAVRQALSELEAAGAVVTDTDAPELDEAEAAYMTSGIVSTECAAFLRRALPDVPPTLDPLVAGRLASALDRSAADYLDALDGMADLALRVQPRFEGFDVLVTPTLPITPPTVASLADLDDYFEANRRMLANTSPVSFLGLCAVSLPVDVDGAGLPVGLQLIAPAGDDPVLLGWARAIEDVLGHAGRRLPQPPRLA